MKGLFSDTHFLVDFLAINRPWPYLVALCSFFTMILVWIGNPTLPIQALATYGWAWHHLPEILSFLFLGMWLGSLGYLSLESLTYHDSFALFLLGIVGIAYAEIISYILLFPIVLTIVFIPSFLGYFAIRLHNIRKSKTIYKNPQQWLKEKSKDPKKPIMTRTGTSQQSKPKILPLRILSNRIHISLHSQHESALNWKKS